MNRLDGTNVFHLLCLTFPCVFMCETGSAGLRKMQVVAFRERRAAWPKTQHARPLNLLKSYFCCKILKKGQFQMKQSDWSIALL